MLTTSAVFHADLNTVCMHVCAKHVWASLAPLGAILHFHQVSLVIWFILGAFDDFWHVSRYLRVISNVWHMSVPPQSIWMVSRLSRPSVHSSAPLAGKSRVTDTIAVILELLTSPSTCMWVLSMPGQLLSPSASSVHDLVLPPGGSGHFWSAESMLTISCVSPAIFAWSAMLCCVSKWGKRSEQPKTNTQWQQKRVVVFLCGSGIWSPQGDVLQAFR